MFFASPLYYLLLCVLVGAFWRYKGRSFGAGVLISLVLTPFVGALIGLALRTRSVSLWESKPLREYKRCPECKEPNLTGAQRCHFCGAVFGDNAYEKLCQRLRTADHIRKQLVAQFGQSNPGMDDHLKAVQYELLELDETFKARAKSYTPQQLRQVLAAFPSKDWFSRQMEGVARRLAQQVACPACGHLQSNEHLLCKNCYADLKQLNPDTGEIEPIKNPVTSPGWRTPRR